MECLEAHTRLEQKKKSVLRRQQRELQKQKQDVRAQEKELDKLALRCLEMEEEDRLSVAMEALHRDEEERKRMESQELDELQLNRLISETRKKTITLGLSASTPGVSGLQRLRLLEARIVEKELALKKSNEAKLRLDALPARRHKLTQLMHSFFSSSLGKKVERIVYQQHWDRLVPLFDVATASYGTRSTDLLNHESENGFTPVLITVFKGKPRVLRRLLELGASPDTETKAGMTPLLAAVMTGDVVALSILVEFKVDLNHETTNQVNAVLLAADKGREEILKALLQYGANVDGVNKAGRSTLIQAAISGNIDLFKILLAYGARKEHRDQGGKAALDWAVQLHNSAIVSALNRFLPGANLLAQLKAEEEEEEDGGVLSSLSTNRTMRQQRAAEMDRAMRMADVVRIRKLLSSDEFQLSPNYEDATGNSPLLVVCSIGTYADTVQCLKSVCIPTHQNREGVNALMIACKRGDVAMMQLLMTYGCNLLTRDFSGRDALHYLNAYDHPDLAIDFTNKYHKYHRENNRGLLLGRIVPTDNFVEPEYTISLVQVDISVGLGSDRDLSCRTVEEPGNAQFSEEDLVCDPVIRQWRIQQEKLKRDRKRRLQFDKERERILAARSRGRRNGLIAPLPSVPAGRLKLPTCDNCQQSRARKRCPSCDQVLCDKCHTRLHELAYRRHHEYEELHPELYVGHELKEVALTNQESSLQNSVVRSVNCVAEMRSLLLGDGLVSPVTTSSMPRRSVDPEVDNYQRKKRIAKEKAISQMQVNVPVVAAKHAAQAGEETVFTQPAELELAALYTSQKKYERARELLGEVEKLILNSMGILHPTMLKVAIGKARISQENGDFEQCVCMMEDALSRFENALPLDHKDILTATSILLQSLDALEHYHRAVVTCRRVYHIRVRAVLPTHQCLKEICEQLDEFLSKRETVDMSKEDLITLDKTEQERKRVKQLASESEKHLANFRRLTMEDPEGLADFVSFAKQEFAEDMVGFWISVEKFKGCAQNGIDSRTLRSHAVNIYLTYIESRSVKVITAAQRKKIKKAITTPGKKLSQLIYDDVQAQIFELVYKGVYVRYLAQAAN
ncbi:Regulator of G protein signaling domain-containing protein [Phytophthora infestans]|uniref:Regulator of G protein signaling domain-containing protein n=1 Tax=Phytophthora infestans TaxID=4787 RepID=A0A8S9V697_PHYIN|nr:Regulator of G protein signaling domain-containing protein [Phytophthora infestans]